VEGFEGLPAASVPTERVLRAGDTEHLDALTALAHQLGCESLPRTTAQPYLARWLQGFRAFLKLDE
jgi:hypothetical protein